MCLRMLSLLAFEQILVEASWVSMLRQEMLHRGLVLACTWPYVIALVPSQHLLQSTIAQHEQEKGK